MNIPLWTLPWMALAIFLCWTFLSVLFVRFVHNGTKTPTPRPDRSDDFQSRRREQLWEEEFRPQARLYDDVKVYPFQKTPRPFDQERD